MNKENENKIIEVIDKLHPFLMNDGGDIEFVKYEDDVVYVKMHGACSHCHMIDYTIKEGVEASIQEVVPSVKEVVNIKD